MIKKGDLVRVIAGKDNGKRGKVLQVLPKLNVAQVEGINILKKHIKSRQKGAPGQKIEFPSPLHISNLQLICPSCDRPSRMGHVIEGEKKQRVCKKCKARL